jgi:hypothetical protein
MAGSFWHSRKDTAGRSSLKAGSGKSLSGRLSTTSSGSPSSHQASKPPSKRRHDRERSIKRDQIFQERREERLRLFGYVLLKNGEVLSIDDALARLRDGARAKENPNITGGIRKDDILDWHAPESFRDVIDSKGEIDVPGGVSYPALGLGEGTVLIDPKLKHRDPALRRQVGK